jgi:hypothetical protein
MDLTLGHAARLRLRNVLNDRRLADGDLEKDRGPENLHPLSQRALWNVRAHSALESVPPVRSNGLLNGNPPLDHPHFSS